jgi:hypothetical protein
MTDEAKPKGILFDPTKVQWTDPDGAPMPNPFKHVPGPAISASPDVLRKLGILPDASDKTGKK